MSLDEELQEVRPDQYIRFGFPATNSIGSLRYPGRAIVSSKTWYVRGGEKSWDGGSPIRFRCPTEHPHLHNLAVLCVLKDGIWRYY